MHRLIMTSAVYQQDSRPIDTKNLDSPAIRNLQSLDPENRLLSHFNRQRLDFEEMRDALLAVSNELDPQMGGKPAEMLAPSNKRRSIYGLVDRQFLPDTFRVFDFANPDLSIAQRHETTVPQQALFFLNHRFVADRAKALQARLKAAGQTSTKEKAEKLYHWLFQRSPGLEDISRAERFIAETERDAPPPQPKPVESAWRYGWGEYDPANQRLKTFMPLPHFTGKAWQGGAKLPDPMLGWVQLTATGGHPGNDLQHAAVRRWIAPRDATIGIKAEITHEPEISDGIHAVIVSSRQGELKAAAVHHGKADLSIAVLQVKSGETIDFVVDLGKELNSDEFLWSPLITTAETDLEASSSETIALWDAKKEFAGLRPPYTPPLNPWEQYAQVLLLSNEFSFVD
jgi:hypothetical protein